MCGFYWGGFVCSHNKDSKPRFWGLLSLGESKVYAVFFDGKLLLEVVLQLEELKGHLGGKLVAKAGVESLDAFDVFQPVLGQSGHPIYRRTTFKTELSPTSHRDGDGKRQGYQWCTRHAS